MELPSQLLWHCKVAGGAIESEKVKKKLYYHTAVLAVIDIFEEPVGRYLTVCRKSESSSVADPDPVLFYPRIRDGAMVGSGSGTNHPGSATLSYTILFQLELFIVRILFILFLRLGQGPDTHNTLRTCIRRRGCS
jgi:hypothetical protein